ncbi:histidine phosphatase family protein [Marinomonas posidonica]|uniref:Phosphoglycerate mutase n=1 Tax=Marinomonas posidonica (strain CECT 7376 / NCIMB 14433 / IVIA-Po-181) TaxID=491952 RepID=F6CVV7_MARPP|nr:histidine phosphatase family protein [Marinomonas posidonica]AEF53165.1 Phosphoglycerate mutase [Marinomonas posidonica IVIA-Po-181]
MILIRKPFVFARHAQSTFNQAYLIGGATDSPLSPLGVKQAKAAQPTLARVQWSQVVTSTLKRTQQTAQFAVPDQSLLPLAALCERNWGVLEGQPIEAQLPYERTPEQGESWRTFELRILEGLNQVLEVYEWPLIIAHSGVYRVLNNYINGTPYCPRIGNVVPISFIPNQNDSGWVISSFEGTFV